MKQRCGPIAVLGALSLAISGCGLIPTSQAQGMHTLSLPGFPASVLVVIVDPDSPQAMRATGALVAVTARPGERAIIISAHDGSTLASSRAPGPPVRNVPDPPTPLPSHATSFQKARHDRAVQKYQDLLSRTRTALLRQQQIELAAWARATVAQAEARQPTQQVSIGAALAVANSDLSSLRQAGVVAAGTVIVIMDATGAPGPLTGLQASTVVVDGFLGTSDEEAAWQSSLVQAGAARAVVLTPATGGQLASVVQQGLDGAVSDTLTSVLFAPGQYKLQVGALPQMRDLLALLIGSYPRATATINGYTDNLPVPGGNLQLSQERAREVKGWLIAHGVVASRLQAFGYGDTDPVAPNSPAGQSLNRRVVVVIDPAAGTGTG